MCDNAYEVIAVVRTLYSVALCAFALPAVAAWKHAAEWKTDARVLPFEGSERVTANAAAEALGLAGVKPIGKWTTGTNGTTHWVVEELPAGLSVSLR